MGRCGKSMCRNSVFMVATMEMKTQNLLNRTRVTSLFRPYSIHAVAQCSRICALLIHASCLLHGFIGGNTRHPHIFMYRVYTSFHNCLLLFGWFSGSSQLCINSCILTVYDKHFFILYTSTVWHRPPEILRIV